MIPKIIHYCWFGDNPYPNIVKKCISSWQKIMPDYEIKLWNEKNVPVQEYRFMKDAYKVGKYAFVSDYARYWILKRHGGFFLDCDVETIRRFDDLRENRLVFAFNKHVKKNILFVNPGLIIGVEKDNPIINDILSIYDKLNFLTTNGQPNLRYSSPRILTKYLLENTELKQEDKCQNLPNGIKILSTDFFDPMNPRTLRMGVEFDITENTHGIHHNAASWVPRSEKTKRIISILLRRIFGDKNIDKLRGKEKQI